MRSRVKHPQMVERQIRQRDVHVAGDLRRLAELGFQAVTTPAVKEEQVQLGSAVRGPKIRLCRPDRPEGLLYGKAFPRGAYPRVGQQAGPIRQAQQAV